MLSHLSGGPPGCLRQDCIHGEGNAEDEGRRLSFDHEDSLGQP